MCSHRSHCTQEIYFPEMLFDHFHCCSVQRHSALTDGAFGLAFLFATLEKVFVLSESLLILKFVFFKLVLDILRDLFGVLPHGIYAVSSTPKRSVAVLVFQIRMPLMYDQTAFSLEKSHKACHTHFRWNLYQHVDYDPGILLLL